MKFSNLKPLVDEAEELLAAIRGSVIVHAQDGLRPEHLKGPLHSARILATHALAIDEPTIRTAADTLEAWLALLAAEGDAISHTKTISLLDQISELEVAIIEYRARSDERLSDVVEFDLSFEDLGRNKPVESTKADEFEIDAEMFEVFREEAASLLQTIRTSLSTLTERPNDSDALWEIKKCAHTFKGAAGVTGQKKASELAHRVEDLLERLSERPSGKTELVSVLNDASDCLEALSNGGGSLDLDSRIASVYAAFDQTLIAVSAPPAGGATVASNGHHPPPAQEGPPADHANAKPAKKSSIVRISLDRLDDLMRNVGEILSSRATLQNGITQFKEQLEESSNNTLRLQAAASRIAALESRMDAPDRPISELSRSLYELSETARDAAIIDETLASLKQGLDDLAASGDNLVDELQKRVRRLRNVEFGTVATRLQRTVRVTCDEEGKDAEVVLENGNLEIDTQIIDLLMDPLMHLLKNAVVHGIETPETRRLLGKPETGKITIEVDSADGHVLLAVTDDGCGIACQPLIEKAVVGGFVTRDDAERMSTAEMCELIFLPGLTTTKKLTLNAGRGVGMSIVRESIEAAGGTITMETFPQRGTTFALRVPVPFVVMDTLGPAEKPSPPKRRWSDRPLVMIVDDSPSVRLKTTRVAEEAGMRVQTARNGVEALEKLSAMGELPKVIVSDIEMPRMGGFEFVGRLRDELPLTEIPVIFISSRSGAEDREQARVAGVTEYLTKPYAENDLIKLLQRMIPLGESPLD